MNAQLTERLRSAATSGDADPVVNDLFNAITEALISRGVSNLLALRAAESAISRLVKESTCQPTSAIAP